MNVVLYLRYSSDKQNEQSIEGQRHICEQYCQSQNMNIIGEYVDRALSATKNIEKREAFQKMIKDSEKGSFSAIIVYKLDRFARNRYDSAVYKSKLRKNNVRVISATESISEAPEGILMESVLEGLAEYYSKELSQKVTRGMRETAMKGNSCGGTIPFGYKVENKKLIIDPINGPIAQEIFKRYTDGETCADIAADLNARGIKTSRGTEFNKNSFRTMLRNKKYIGVLKYNDIILEDAIPALIDKNTFDLAVAKLEQNKHAPARKKGEGEFILSTKAFCGHCESPMIGDSGTGKNGMTYYYYTCAKRKNLKNCDKKSIGKDELEGAVIKDIFDFLTPENIEIVADTAIAHSAYKCEKSNAKTIMEQIKEIDKTIENVMKIAEHSENPERFSKRIDELYNQRDDLQEQLAKAEEDALYFSKENIVYWLKSSIERYRDDPKLHKRLIDMLINSVTVWDEPDGYKLTIVYNLTRKNPKTIKISDLSKNGSPKNLGSYATEIFYFFTLHFSLEKLVD